MDSKTRTKNIIVQKTLRVISIIILISFAVYFRSAFINEKGSDSKIFVRAIESFLDGKNIYVDTVESYSKGYTDEHGYAYFPTLLYIYIPLYRLSEKLIIEPHILFKIPVFLADILVGILIFKILYDEDKKFWFGYLGALFWALNPHLIMRGSYAHTEPLGVLFMILALKNLSRDDVKAGLFYAISFSLKSFSLVLFPIFLLKSRNKIKFLASGAFFALLISIPFMNSFKSFFTYIRGSILVHGSREPQGRPILGYASYLINKSKYYVMVTQPLKYLSLTLGSVISFLLYFKKKVTDKYVLATISMLFLYLFTPVLMRTYLIWLMPVYAIGSYRFLNQFKGKLKKWFGPAFVSSIVLFWGLYAYYLLIWDKGFWFSENGIGL